MLTLAADNLQELSVLSDVELDIFGSWRGCHYCGYGMDDGRVMNLLKNCMEHSPAGARVHWFYEQNPLYVQIRIWDEGRDLRKRYSSFI